MSDKADYVIRTLRLTPPTENLFYNLLDNISPAKKDKIYNVIRDYQEELSNLEQSERERIADGIVELIKTIDDLNELTIKMEAELLEQPIKKPSSRPPKKDFYHGKRKVEIFDGPADQEFY